MALIYRHARGLGVFSSKQMSPLSAEDLVVPRCRLIAANPVDPDQSNGHIPVWMLGNTDKYGLGILLY